MRCLAKSDEILARRTHSAQIKQKYPSAIKRTSRAPSNEAAPNRHTLASECAPSYEQERGWVPDDVSHKNLGFDIRSFAYNKDGIFSEARYIEVKARQKSGGIRLTANEWKMARRYQDKYCLYIVTQAASVSPQLDPIQNPALKFREGEDIFATGFIVPEAKWRERIEKENG